MTKATNPRCVGPKKLKIGRNTVTQRCPVLYISARKTDGFLAAATDRPWRPESRNKTGQEINFSLPNVLHLFWRRHGVRGRL